jgi:DNA-binding transcriptional MerR regulator
MIVKYSLRELADQVDIPPRTIRSYIEKGIIPSAEGAGRASYYGPKHLRRLLAIRVLRDIDNVDFDGIRRAILLASENEIERIARRLNPMAGGSAHDYLLAALEHEPTSPPGGEMFELRKHSPEPSILEAEAFRPSGDAGILKMDTSSEHLPAASLGEALSIPVGQGTWLDTAVSRELENVARNVGQVPRRAKSTSASHIQITPDVELVVKGNADPDHLTRVERLADVLRHLLMGGGRG